MKTNLAPKQVMALYFAAVIGAIAMLVTAYINFSLPMHNSPSIYASSIAAAIFTAVMRSMARWGSQPQKAKQKRRGKTTPKA